MPEEQVTHLYSDYKQMLDYLDSSFGQLAGELVEVIPTGMADEQDAESHLLMSVCFPPSLWTAMVWDDWEANEIENMKCREAGLEPRHEDTLDIMTEHFNGLADLVADHEFSPEQGHTLPMNGEEAEPFGYYAGFEKLKGWQELMSAIRSYGLACQPFLAPLDDNIFGIGLVIHSGTDQPLLDFIRSGKVQLTGDWSGTAPILN